MCHSISSPHTFKEHQHNIQSVACPFDTPKANINRGETTSTPPHLCFVRILCSLPPAPSEMDQSSTHRLNALSFVETVASHGRLPNCLRPSTERLSRFPLKRETGWTNETLSLNACLQGKPFNPHTTQSMNHSNFNDGRMACCVAIMYIDRFPVHVITATVSTD